MPSLPRGPEYFVTQLRAMQRAMRDSLLMHLRSEQPDQPLGAPLLSTVASGRVTEGDTIYRLDERGEDVLFAFCEEWSRELPFLLVAEGIPGDGGRMFPPSEPRQRATFVCIVDPVDGTRGLMYSKRSAWVLAGVAPPPAGVEWGALPTLADVAVAAQTEVPTPRARLADVLWAASGEGAAAETHDLAHDGAPRPFVPQPSAATTLAHGFAAIAKFFPGTKELAARLEEQLFAEVAGEDASGNPLVFDDEYISSGGQLYELAVGHDRFLADLRPLLLDLVPSAPGGARRLCARPYDLCTELIAREAGVEVTDPWGRPLAAPLDVRADVAWVGYANRSLRARIQPVLQRLLREMTISES